MFVAASTLAFVVSACSLDAETLNAEGSAELARHRDSPLAQVIEPPPDLELSRFSASPGGVREQGGIFDSKIVVPTRISHDYVPSDEHPHAEPKDFVGFFAQELSRRGADLIGCTPNASNPVLLTDLDDDDVEIVVSASQFAVSIFYQVNEPSLSEEDRSQLVPCSPE